MTPGRRAALQRTLGVVSARLAVARVRDPWWVIGSAAAALSGVDGFDPHDVDLLLSERDAEALLAAHRDEVDTAYAPADDDRFRSRFARLRGAPMPIEAMGALDVRRDGAWRRIEIADTAWIEIGAAAIPVPTLPEQLRLFEWFGRDKDLAKARLLRAHLASDGRSDAA